MAKLAEGRSQGHPTDQGDVTEEGWRQMLRSFLPRRYGVDKALVVDSTGQTSNQIDIVIHDTQYAPTLLDPQGGSRTLTAESVYAVLEVKQDLDKHNLEYAASKAASVRRLHRTSGVVTHVEGKAKGKTPHRIVAGIATSDSAWTPAFGDAFAETMASLTGDSAIDMGCVLGHGTFEYADGNLTTSSADVALITFVLRLFRLLQPMGTAPAIDVNEYGKAVWGSRAQDPWGPDCSAP